MGWVCLLSYQNILKKKNQPSKQYNHLELYANGYIQIDARRNVEIVLVTQSCPTLCSSMDCSPLGSSVHGTFQARILEWEAIPFSRGSSPSRDWTWVSCIAGRFFTIWAMLRLLERKKKKAGKQANKQTLGGFFQWHKFNAFAYRKDPVAGKDWKQEEKGMTED